MREAMIVDMMVFLILNCNQHLNLKCCSSIPSFPWMPDKLVFPTENGQSWRRLALPTCPTQACNCQLSTVYLQPDA